VVPQCLVPYIGGCGKLCDRTIYRTPYRDPKERRWLSGWAETRVTAESWRAEIEQRSARKKLEIAIDRFEINPGKSDIVRS